jgi:hypothetical protein
MKRCHRVGPLPGSTETALAVTTLGVGAVSPEGDGLIWSPTTIKRFMLVPGGSQVISVAVAACP